MSLLPRLEPHDVICETARDVPEMMRVVVFIITMWLGLRLRRKPQGQRKTRTKQGPVVKSSTRQNQRWKPNWKYPYGSWPRCRRRRVPEARNMDRHCPASPDTRWSPPNATDSSVNHSYEQHRSETNRGRESLNCRRTSPASEKPLLLHTFIIIAINHCRHVNCEGQTLLTNWEMVAPRL